MQVDHFKPLGFSDNSASKQHSNILLRCVKIC